MQPQASPPPPRGLEVAFLVAIRHRDKLRRQAEAPSVSFFLAGEEWVDHAPSARAGRMRWPHISAATKRARYSGVLVRACVRNGKAIFLCVVLRFQLGLFSSVTFFVRVFPTMRSLHSAGKFVATEINTLLNASESLLIFSLSLPLEHSLSHSHLSSPSDLLTCADKLCG